MAVHSSPPLEAAYIPDAARVAAALRRSVRGEYA